MGWVDEGDQTTKICGSKGLDRNTLTYLEHWIMDEWTHENCFAQWFAHNNL